jgi:hypothetical protein
VTRILQTELKAGEQLTAQTITNLIAFPIGLIPLLSYVARQVTDQELQKQQDSGNIYGAGEQRASTARGGQSKI